MKARLLESREIAPNTRHFEFETIDWTAAFVPGQFLSLTHTLGEDPITRAYSIASPPDGNRFALCANLVQDGHFSPFLFEMKIGDEVDFKGPYGAFILRRPVSDSIFVATGTGIAPFRSMLHAKLAEHRDHRFTLIFGVRHEHSLLYHDEWTALARTAPNFEYLPTLTRPAPAWTGLAGRVHEHVLRTLGGRRDIDIYICGLREMVDELRAKLKEIGVDRKRMIYEKYD
ncbi:MAG: FAD-dependent oxidoreductase [Acidobacteriota bacterium]|nr:FAD-dependent oxidoreductase [Acidobacteriota bacterium]